MPIGFGWHLKVCFAKAGRGLPLPCLRAALPPKALGGVVALETALQYQYIQDSCCDLVTRSYDSDQIGL